MNAYKDYPSFKTFKYLFGDVIDHSSEALFRAAWILAVSLLFTCLCCVGITAMLKYAKEATIRMKLLEQADEIQEEEEGDGGINLND